MTLIDHDDRAAVIMGYVSKERFELLQTIALFLLIFWLIALTLYFWFQSRILNFINNAFIKLVADVKSLFRITHDDKWIFRGCLTFLILHSGYYIASWALQHDECWSYNYFVSKNFAFSFLTPHNNHNGYTLLAWLSKHLPIPAIIAYRGWSLLMGVLALIVYRKWSSIILSQDAHRLSLMLFTGSMPLMYYSIIARSYSATLLFFCIGLLCVSQLHRYHRAWKYLAISSAVGLFFNPIYLYAIITLYCFSWIQTGWSQLKNMVSSFTLTIILALVLVGIPLIAFRGYLPLVNVVQQKGDFMEVGIQSLNMLTYYFTSLTNLGWLWVLIIVFLTVTYFPKKEKINLLLALGLILPIIFCLLQRQVLFERIFTYLVPLLAMSLTLVFHQLSKKVLVSIGIIFIGLQTFLFPRHPLFEWNIKMDHAIEKMAQTCISKRINNIYLFDNYVKPGLIYQYQQNNQPLTIEMSMSSSIHHKDFDSTKTYPCIISTLEHPHYKNGYNATLIDSIYIIQTPKN